MKKVLILLIILSGCSEKKSQNKPLNFDPYLKKLNQNIPRDSLIHYANTIPIDSTKIKLLFNYSYHFFKERDSANFLYWNNRTLELARKLSDTSKIAESYWDLGSYYYDLGTYDSAYYYYSKSFQNYNIINDIPHSAKMLYSMGIVQKDLRDYQGSENTTVDAIKLFEKIDDKKGIYYGYNNLAVIYNNFEQFETSLLFHEQALEKARDINNPELIATSLNNIGVVYKNLQNLPDAIQSFRKGLEVDHIKSNNARLYARLLDNLAFVKLTSENFDIVQIHSELLESQKIRESLSDQPGISISNIHMAEYFFKRGDTVHARNQFLAAYRFAKKIESASDILYILNKLSVVDSTNSKEYLKEYITISDSLMTRERKVRNKFARTKYQTDKIEKANQKLISQREVIIAGSIGIIIIISLLSFLISQRNRNKKLKLEQTQIRNNQEIFELLLTQHEKLEEGRKMEKKRISRELHDGVLGKLFGVRFLLSNVISGQSKEEKIESMKYLAELKDIEQEIRLISHNLSDASDQFEEDFKSILINFLLREENTSGINIKFDLKGDDVFLNFLPISYKVSIYRILQEAVFNVIKHADATDCKIKIGTYPEKLIIRIKDNGKGFNVQGAKGGIGLGNIADRVNEMKGVWNIISKPGETEIEIILNIKNE